MSAIRKIVLHCSDSPDNLDIGVAEIRAWHTMPPPQGRGWTDVGYHAVVRRSGAVEQGRFENGDSVLEGKEIGAHVAGHNSDSLSLCLVGRSTFTPDQIDSALHLVAGWMRAHDVPIEAVFGHYELDPKKTCPNFPMNVFRRALATLLLAA